MASNRADLKYPIRGISETYGFSYAEELTSRDERNMRSVDPTNGRIRGAQRAGIGVYSGAAQQVTDKKIKALGSVQANKVQLDYAEDLTPIADAANSPYAFSPDKNCVDFAQDDYGNFYALADDGQVTVLNEELGVIAKFKLPSDAVNPSSTTLNGSTDQQPPVATCIDVDEYLNIYIGTGAGSATLPKWCALYCYTLRQDDTYELAWTHHLDAYALDVKHYKNNLYVLTCTAPAKTDGVLDAATGSMKYTDGSSVYKLTFNNEGDWGVQPTPGDKLTIAYDDGSGSSGTLTGRVVKSSDPASVTLAVAATGLTHNTDYTVALTLWPKYIYVRVDQYIGAGAEGIGDQLDQVPVVQGYPFLTFTADGFVYLKQDPDPDDEYDFSQSHTTWPGAQPRAGDRISITNAFKDQNNGEFFVKHATPSSLFLLAADGSSDAGLMAESAADHLEVVGKERIRVQREEGGYTSKIVDVYNYTSGSSPTIYLNSSGYVKTIDTGSLSHEWFSGQLAIDDTGRMYATWASQLSTTMATAESLLVALPTDTAEGLVTSEAEIHNTGTTADHSGIGLAASAGPEVAGLPSVITAGDKLGTNTASRHLRRWKLDGTSFVADSSFLSSGLDLGSTNWRDATPGAQKVRLGKDIEGNWYVPWRRPGGTLSGGGASPYTTDVDMFVVPADGTEANIKKFHCDGDEFDSTVVLCCAAPDYTFPDYSGSTTAPKTHEFALLGATPGSGAGAAVYRAELVTVTQSRTVSPRELYVLSVSGAKFGRVTSGGITDITPASDSGVAALDATAPYVQMAAAFGKIYITDGRSYYQYDPSTGANGTITDWACTSYGRIPKRCRLVEVWRGRMVLAKDPADPSAWYMSRSFDPNNWDNFPQNPSAADAISARNSRAGGVPDTINTIIPYTDDLLLFGCDNSIWRLTGDPRAGGQLDLITDQSGISFGRPWCKDPSGVLYFFGAEGGLYRMTPASGVQYLSGGRVARALQDIDLGANYVQLVWNYLDEGVHIFVCPFSERGDSGFGALADHWFYDVRNNAFHKDRFGLADQDYVQPSAALAVNGDLFNDRVILLGGEDSRIRRWGRDSSGNVPASDEQDASTNIAIDSYVTAGPLLPVSSQSQGQLTEFTAVLGDSLSGANFEFFATDDPETLGLSKASGTLRAGRNRAKLIRVAGDSLFMRLRNASAEQTWAYESGSVKISAAGDKR